MSARLLAAVTGTAAALALVLSGCASGSQNAVVPEQRDDGTAVEVPDQPQQDTAATQGEATFSAGGRTFTVELSMCAVYDEGDVLLSGPAREVGTDVTGYLDGDVTMLDSEAYAEFRIDVGADAALQSTDEFLALGNSLGGSFAISEQVGGYEIRADAWNASGDDLGEGSLAFSCS